MTDDNVVLSGIWTDLEFATRRDLMQSRHRRVKHSMLAVAVAVIVLGSGVAVAAQQGILPDIFGAQQRGSDQVAGLENSGRPISTTDVQEGLAYSMLSHAYKRMSPGRVLIDRTDGRGEQFRLIGATTQRGWICSTSLTSRGAGGAANCIPRLDPDRPVTTQIDHLPNRTWVVSGLAVNGVGKITIETAAGKHTADIQNHAYVWFGTGDEVPTAISVQRPDGSLFHYPFPPMKPQDYL